MSLWPTCVSEGPVGRRQRVSYARDKPSVAADVAQKEALHLARVIADQTHGRVDDDNRLDIWSYQEFAGEDATRSCHRDESRKSLAPTLNLPIGEVKPSVLRRLIWLNESPRQRDFR